MTFYQLVQNINHTRKAKFTDFVFEDGFLLIDPQGITKATARRRYKETKGVTKAPQIEDCFWFVAE